MRLINPNKFKKYSLHENLTLLEGQTIRLPNGQILQLSDEELMQFASGLASTLGWNESDFNIPSTKKIESALSKGLPYAYIIGFNGPISQHIPGFAAGTDSLQKTSFMDLYNKLPTSKSGNKSRAARSIAKAVLELSGAQSEDFQRSGKYAVKGKWIQNAKNLVGVEQWENLTARNSMLRPFKADDLADSLMPSESDLLRQAAGEDPENSVLGGLEPVNKWVESISPDLYEQLESTYRTQLGKLYTVITKYTLSQNSLLMQKVMLELLIENQGDERAQALLDELFTVPISALEGEEKIIVPDRLKGVAEIGGKFGGDNIGKGELVLPFLFDAIADPGEGANATYDISLNGVHYHVKGGTGPSATARIGNLSGLGLLDDLYKLDKNVPTKKGEISDEDWKYWVSNFPTEFYNIIKKHISGPVDIIKYSPFISAQQIIDDFLITNFLPGSGGVIWYDGKDYSIQMSLPQKVKVDKISNGSLKIGNPLRTERLEKGGIAYLDGSVEIRPEKPDNVIPFSPENDNLPDENREVAGYRREFNKKLWEWAIK